MPHASEKAKGHLAILLAMIFFGLNGPLSKELLSPGGVTPWVHMFVRFSGAALLFWLCTPIIGTGEPDRRDLPRLFLASMCGIVINLGSFAFAISITSAVEQSLIATLGPVMTMILAALLLREPITWLKALGVAVGTAGVVLLVISRPGGMERSSVLGAVLSLVATLGYSLYLTLFKSLIVKYHPVVLMKWMFLFAAITVAPLGLPAVLRTDWQSLSPTLVGYFAFVVLFSTFVSYLLVPISQKRIRPTVVSMYSYEMPLIATIAALSMGQEELTPLKGVAALLILIGVYMVSTSPARADLDRRRRQGRT